MKDATGELSTTVITIVAIAAISTLFVVFLLPTLRRQIVLNQACSNGPGYSGLSGNTHFVSCDGADTDVSWTCSYYDGTSASGSLTGTKVCSTRDRSTDTNQ